VSEATTYLKCGCDHCGGRIEFPGEAAGASVHCPHCGALTTLFGSLPVKRRSQRIRKRIVLPIFFAALASALVLGVLVWPRSLIVREFHVERASTNSPGSVTGVIENWAARPVRNVRAEVSLLNSRGETLWQASDYAAEIPPRATWRFRALVIDPNVVTGKVAVVRSR
jgi:hypothetical protein